jgi:4-diphosphocytidyl-2-C-methyl-D-erythritol kinase
MKLLAPAKINLHLRVGPVNRQTGFHPLMSWFCTVGLFDTLLIEQDPNSAEPFILTCDDPALPCDATNLVVRAADALRRGEGESAQALSKIRAQLQKRIPAGGGLGGGSSDAARTLLGLNRMWLLNHSIEHLSGIAATLGSDVPFFLHGPSSVCTSRGEVVDPIRNPKPKAAVLVFPGIAISTPAAYRVFDEMKLGDPDSIRTPPDWQQWAELSAGPLLSRLVNDLEAPAFAMCPELASLRLTLEKSLGRTVRMSGSGSTLFTLFDDFAEAELAVARIQECCGLRALATQLAPTICDDLASPHS